MEFSERLGKIMKDRCETNYKLAKEIGVHQSTVANWKKGMIPQLEHQRLLAEHFGCTVDELLKED